MQTMTITELHTAMKEQSATDLIEAGAGANFDSVQGFLGFSCIGRFDTSKGCNWTLGGLFKLHELEIVTEDGERYPRFKVSET